MKIIITERQEDLLKENIPAALRRRYNQNTWESHLDVVIEDINPCDFTREDFVGKVCDITLGDILYDYHTYHGAGVKSETKDDLYNFMVNKFGDYLRYYYLEKCN